MKILFTICHRKAEEQCSDANHKDLAKEDYKVGDLIDKETAENIGGDEVKSIFGCFAEIGSNHCCHDIGVSVKILDHLFEAVEAATEKHADGVENFVM